MLTIAQQTLVRPGVRVPAASRLQRNAFLEVRPSFALTALSRHPLLAIQAPAPLTSMSMQSESAASGVLRPK
jgi:hypothetical protein